MNDSTEPAPETSPSHRRHLWQHSWVRAILVFVTLLLTYFVVTYIVVPQLWLQYAHHHPALENIPNITYTHDGHPGDPINVALIGKEDDLKRSMLAAGWYPADPITLRSCLKIAAGTVLRRSYDDAPVSNLYLWHRKQDLAFEQPVGKDPRRRHHVRFWKSEKVDDANRPVWVGSATYDERVGFSDTTGEITHHIAPDVDAERDHLFDDLKKAGDLMDFETIEDFHKIRDGRNGGGDPWHTDGNLFVGTLVNQASAGPIQSAPVDTPSESGANLPNSGAAR